LLYIARLEAIIHDLDLNNKTIELKSFNLRSVYGNFYQFNDSVFNFTFILENLKSGKLKPLSWTIKCDQLSANNGSADVNTHKGKSHHFSNFTLKAESILIDSANQSFVLNHFASNINNENFVENISVDVRIRDKQIKILDLNCQLKSSSANLPSAVIQLPNKSTNTAFSYNANVAAAQIKLNDLGIFIPTFKNVNTDIRLSGSISGNKNNIKGNDIKIGLGNESNLACNLSLYNFGNIELINYSLDIQNFYTTKSDALQILAYFNQDTSLIPNTIKLIDEFSYKGIINGDYYNIYNKGEILSQFGQINSDISIKRNPNDDNILIDGNLKAKPIYPEGLIKNKLVKEISFDINTKGSYSKSSGPNLDIKGIISRVHLTDYILDSINLSGNISNNLFEGSVSSYDPNLRFDFDGLIKLDTIPSYDFSMILYSANLHNLNLNKKDSSANLSFVIKADCLGNNIDNSYGEIQISDIFYFTDTSYFATDSVYINSFPINEGKRMYLYSEYAEANFDGQFNVLTLYRSIKTLISNYLPSLGIAPSKIENTNNISFDIIANYPHPITELFDPDFRISPGTHIYGALDAKNLDLNITCESDKIDLKYRNFEKFSLKTFIRNNKLSLNITSDEFNYSKNNSLKNFAISTVIYNDSIETNLNWNNWLNRNYSGNINTLITLSASAIIDKPNLKIDIFPGNIIVLDTLWFLSKAFIKKDSTGITFNDLKIDNGRSKWELSGIYSDNPNDSIALNVQNVNMNLLNILIKSKNLIFGGTVTGNTLIKDLKGQRKINSDLFVKNLSLNHEIIGDTKLDTKWNNDEKKLLVLGSAKTNNSETFGFCGYISPQNKEINIDTYFTNQPLSVIAPFLEPTIDQLEGVLNGEIKVHGELKNPMWTGQVLADKANLRVTPTNVAYNFSDTVFFDKHDIIFNNITAFDYEKNKAILNGKVSHEYFIDFLVDLKLKSDKILAINLKSKDSPYYYGKMYGSGNFELKRVGTVVDINIAAKTEGPSFVQIPLDDKGDIKENDFIEFTNPYQITNTKSKKEDGGKKTLETKAVTNIRMDLEVTPDLEVQIIFDPRIGDMIRANGVAQLTLESLGSKFNMYGDYTITKGDFMFTLQNVINKHLDIQQGSTVSFTGHPLDANIDLDAVYRVRKASVYELTLDEADKEKRVEVNTHLLMTGKLVNPNINFSVDVPSATNEEAIDQLNSLPEEDLNKQVLSLLLVNRFTALTTYRTGIADNTTSNLTTTTASELLSNQLSNWMSQISNDFDLGFVYRPSDDNTEQEVEFALSTNLFNDRVIFNGNVGYSKNQQYLTDNPYTTDFQIEYKLNDKGNLRLRAFQKPNNDITNSESPNVQGVGIFYTDEFDTFNDLINKMFRKESGIKPKKIKITKDNSDLPQE
jgi:hypothetical protein